jgi:hypothetical protein
MRILPVVPLCRRRAALLKAPNQHHPPACPVLDQEGRFAIVERRVRDAVDALATQDRAALTRTAKSCGPDAPTLASSFAGLIPRKRRWQKSPVTGESAEQAVKTIRVRECRVKPV